MSSTETVDSSSDYTDDDEQIAPSRRPRGRSGAGAGAPALAISTLPLPAAAEVVQPMPPSPPPPPASPPRRTWSPLRQRLFPTIPQAHKRTARTTVPPRYRFPTEEQLARVADLQWPPSSEESGQLSPTVAPTSSPLPAPVPTSPQGQALPTPRTSASRRSATPPGYGSPQAEATLPILPNISSKRHRKKTLKAPRYKPPARLLREIRYLQRTTHLLIPAAAFSRLVREITNDVTNHTAAIVGLRYQGLALRALHEAAEAYLIGLMEDAFLISINARRVTLMDRDMRLARRIRGDLN